MTKKYAIKASSLRKTYFGKVEKTALDGINLNIPKGSFFGLLGNNGAGKSTFINILAGLVIKTEGNVIINNYNIDDDIINAKKSIGIVPQELVLDTFFTVREALEIYAGYYGIAKKLRRTDEIIEAMGLQEKADDKSRSLSGGMKRRLLIGKALVHNPPILVLDEPTAGVDVGLRTQLWDYVLKLNAAGTTIILTTHYLKEAEKLCDEIAIIDKGSIISNSSKKELMQKFANKKLIITASNENFNFDKLQDCGWNINRCEISVNYNPTIKNVENLLIELHIAGVTIADISVNEVALEDVFLNLIKNI